MYFQILWCGFSCTIQTSYKELLSELQKFLDTEKDEIILEIPNPPPKKIRLQKSEDGLDSLSQNGEGKMSVIGDKNIASKNSNLNVCNVCLGILQEFCEKEFVKKVCEKVEASGYEFTNLVFSVSFPPQLSVREHAAWLLVKQEMGKQNLSLGRNDIVQLKEAYKWITHPLFSEELGVPIDGKSLFEVSVVFAHPETVEDCHFLGSVCPDCFKPAKNKQSVFTRMAVMKALNKIKEEDFLKQFPCPPSSPETVCTVLEIECAHGAVFVAGRYNKYSRNLPQTPWIIDGERKLESSVEELISDHLLTVFKAESFNFSSSGREDVDVRTLGNGRPFAIELVNPHRVHFTSQEIKELQQKINNSSDKIQVRDLQLVTREAIGHMKEGEEEKTKTYSALIWTNKVIERKDIEFLNDLKIPKIQIPNSEMHKRYEQAAEKEQLQMARNHLKRYATSKLKDISHFMEIVYLIRAKCFKNQIIIEEPQLEGAINTALIKAVLFGQNCSFLVENSKEDLKIDQKTPLRVLHRRPLAVRTRIIHTMETHYVDKHHFRLCLKTQAGTYIKEFVHGDFGRTTPNIGSLMNVTADILELDVESVDVDWPPPLD